MISVSAPAKVHLIGEHAVVYGYPAILGAINKRIKIDLEKSNKIKISYQKNKKLLKRVFEIKDCQERAQKANQLWKEGDKKGDFSSLFNFLKSNQPTYLKTIVGFLLNYFKIQKGVSLKIKSEIEMSAGLGSSAALSVALTKGLSSLFNIKLSKKGVNEIAYQIERLNHGRPSGGDNTISAFGGILFFEKGEFRRLEVPDFLENLIIVLTKRKELTGQLVQKVKNLDPKLKKSLIKNIGKNTQKMEGIISQGDFENFKNLINKTQDDLKKLQVSTPKIDEIVKKIREIGGAAKLSGAGGGGAILCFHQERKKLLSKLREIKSNFFEAKIEKVGVKINSVRKNGAF